MYDATFTGGSIVDRGMPATWSRPVPHYRDCGEDGSERQFTASRAPHAASEPSASGDGRAVRVRIYRPARSVLQAGRANTGHWLLEFEPRSAPFIEPLMGWTGTEDTLRQVRLRFPTRERAVAFAKRQGWAWKVVEPRVAKLRPKRYADNFRYRRPRDTAGRSPAMVPGLGALPV